MVDTSSTASALTYEVVVADGVERHTELRLPDGGPIVSSPLSSTLIHGCREMVLVDPCWTIQQTTLLGDRIEATGRRLVAVYITHGHGDHWFGTAQLLKRFPGVQVYATPGTIALMDQQNAARPSFWDILFPGLIGPSPVLAKPVSRRYGHSGWSPVTRTGICRTPRHDRPDPPVSDRRTGTARRQTGATRVL
ncbi:hypothetical protein GONAM_02_01910 [Gordonia namibiensis NBRC 108229]|uniref:Metallo-beta-lactamase domain-containing protein n=1 Tax=Gordonia namibiensis NBRC 108229 TaxID=1208314 RepID=K6VR31_9ACTN|nr:MBL fold metallo-hydrolase [Gordonia namibiensis]GAB98668.1 hypothetical protein GONAM_02_01910 [Gordonia namibiensis NBRC 108229]